MPAPTLWICPVCDRKFAKPNQGHMCSTKTVADLFVKKAPALLPVMEALAKKISKWKGVSYGASTNTVVFTVGTAFLVARPMKNALDLHFYLPQAMEDFPVYKVAEYNNKFVHYIRLYEMEDLTNDVVDIIQLGYKFVLEKHR